MAQSALEGQVSWGGPSSRLSRGPLWAPGRGLHPSLVSLALIRGAGKGPVSCSEAAAGMGNSPKKGLETLKSSQPRARGTPASCCLAPRAAGRDAL